MTFTAAPPIDTERLELRGHRAADFDECFAMWSDPVVTRYIGNKPSTRTEVWARLIRYVGHWTVLGFGFWVIRERSTGRFVGEAGFFDMKRGIGPTYDNSPEIGWILAPTSHGKGYATEAVQRIVAWGDQHLASSRSVCMIEDGNLASVRVAEKSGYREFMRGSIEGDPVTYFERG